MFLLVDGVVKLDNHPHPYKEQDLLTIRKPKIHHLLGSQPHYKADNQTFKCKILKEFSSLM